MLSPCGVVIKTALRRGSRFVCTAVWPSQHMQWLKPAVSEESGDSHQSSADVRNEWSSVYLHFHMRFHVVQMSNFILISVSSTNKELYQELRITLCPV
jgi:hypothetical protein